MATTPLEAASADDLSTAIEVATSARFEVFVPEGIAPIARGTVGGDPGTLDTPQPW